MQIITAWADRSHFFDFLKKKKKKKKTIDEGIFILASDRRVSMAPAINQTDEEEEGIFFFL